MKLAAVLQVPEGKMVTNYWIRPQVIWKPVLRWGIDFGQVFCLPESTTNLVGMKTFTLTRVPTLKTVLTRLVARNHTTRKADLMKTLFRRSKDLMRRILMKPFPSCQVLLTWETWKLLIITVKCRYMQQYQPVRINNIIYITIYANFNSSQC